MSIKPISNRRQSGLTIIRLRHKGLERLFAHREIVREDYLKPLGISVTAAAKWLKLSRQSLSEMLNGHNGISADMAIRLEKAGWGNAETWLRPQLKYELWQARNRAEQIDVKPYPARPAAA